MYNPADTFFGFHTPCNPSPRFAVMKQHARRHTTRLASSKRLHPANLRRITTGAPKGYSSNPLIDPGSSDDNDVGICWAIPCGGGHGEATQSHTDSLVGRTAASPWLL